MAHPQAARQRIRRDSADRRSGRRVEKRSAKRADQRSDKRTDRRSVAQRRIRRIMRALRHVLTGYVSTLGWVTIGIGALSFAAFARFGWHELLAIGAIMTTMMLAALLMSLGNTGFRASIDVSNKRVAVGDEVCVNVDIDNPGRTATTTARGDLPIGTMHERFSIPMLAPSQSKRTVVQFTAMSRAVLGIGPLRVRKGDPFGLARHEKDLAERVTIFIHPRIVHLPNLDAGVARDLEGQPSGQIVDDDLDFYGLREYRPGDDVRNVHWLSSSKTGTLMIRQYEATRRTDTSLTISVNPEDYTSPDEFELALSVYASIGVQCLALNRPLASHAANAHATPKLAMAFLDSCSTIVPDRGDDPNLVRSTLAHTPDASFYYFVVGSIKSIDQVKRMLLALPASARRLVIQTVPGANKSIRRFEGFTLATVASLDDLPLVMEALS